MILAAVLLIFPVGDVLYFWEHQIPVQNPEKVDGIIVLGGAINPIVSDDVGQISFNLAAERLTSLIPLMRQYPQARIVYSGGSGDLQNPDQREADYAAQLFKEWQLPIERITFERNSRNTYENAIFSKKIMLPKKHEHWLLVTSASHMLRANAVFDKLDWPVIPYPVDYHASRHPDVFCFCLRDNLIKIDMLVHEVIGFAIYRVTGKA